jgi:hypothetical protein
MPIHRHFHLHFTFLLVLVTVLIIIAIIIKLRSKKAPKKLSLDKFDSTRSAKMIELADSEKNMFNIWPFVNELKGFKIVSKKINENELIYKVYRDTTETFEHILLATEKENEFIVIIVNLTTKKVKGYFPLDLNKKNLSYIS